MDSIEKVLFDILGPEIIELQSADHGSLNDHYSSFLKMAKIIPIYL